MRLLNPARILASTLALTRNSAYLLALTISTQAPHLAAQTVTPLSLAEAVRRAGMASTTALLAGGRRAVLTGEAREKAQWQNPALELRREGIRKGEAADDFATLTLPLNLFGNRTALQTALEKTRLGAAADSTDTRREVEYAAARSWWQAWAGHETARIISNQAETHSRVAELDSARAAAGEISEAAAMRIQLEAQRSRYEAAQARAESILLLGELASLIGEINPETLSIASPTSDWPSLPPLTELTMQSQQRPDLIRARALEAAAEQRRTAADRGSMSEIDLTGGYKGTAGLGSAVLGISLPLPILNRNSGAREQAMGEWMIASAERRLAELRASTQVHAAYQAAALLDTASRGFDAAFTSRVETVTSAAMASYQEGEVTLVELLDALRAAAEARTAMIHATLSRALAHLELRYAIGAPAVENK